MPVEVCVVDDVYTSGRRSTPARAYDAERDAHADLRAGSSLDWK
jgi:hypothetical protein